MERRAMRWLEWLCLATLPAVAVSAALAWLSGAEVDWRWEAASVALLLPTLALLWWAARATNLQSAARALTWAGWVLVAQGMISLVRGLLEPGPSPVPVGVLVLAGGVGTLLSLLPGLALLALAAVLREVGALVEDEALTV